MILRLKNLQYYLIYRISSFFFSRSFKVAPDQDLNRSDKVIVSLTTKPDRVHKTWMVVESILRQKEKPNAIILYLAADEFENEEVLPKRLREMQKRGLQIVFVADNLKPHNKYYYAMSAFPKAYIITVDDDKIYPSNLVGTLKRYGRLYKNKICAVLTRKIKAGKDEVETYKNWDLVKSNQEPSHSLLSLGVGGVNYPPCALHEDLFNKDELRNRTLLTDDMWIKIMALRNDTKVVSLAGLFRTPFISITGVGKEQLMHKNIHGGENDKVFKDLMGWYNIDIAAIKD